jgi:hypothetical protein
MQTANINGKYDDRYGENYMKIGAVTLDNNIFLAPMAGVTDMPFRMSRVVDWSTRK